MPLGPRLLVDSSLSRQTSVEHLLRVNRAARGLHTPHTWPSLGPKGGLLRWQSPLGPHGGPHLGRLYRSPGKCPLSPSSRVRVLRCPWVRVVSALSLMTWPGGDLLARPPPRPEIKHDAASFSELTTWETLGMLFSHPRGLFKEMPVFELPVNAHSPWLKTAKRSGPVRPVTAGGPECPGRRTSREDCVPLTLLAFSSGTCRDDQ